MTPNLGKCKLEISFTPSALLHWTHHKLAIIALIFTCHTYPPTPSWIHRWSSRGSHYYGSASVQLDFAVALAHYLCSTIVMRWHPNTVLCPMCIALQAMSMLWRERRYTLKGCYLFTWSFFFFRTVRLPTFYIKKKIFYFKKKIGPNLTMLR